MHKRSSHSSLGVSIFRPCINSKKIAPCISRWEHSRRSHITNPCIWVVIAMVSQIELVMCTVFVGQHSKRPWMAQRPLNGNIETLRKYMDKLHHLRISVASGSRREESCMQTEDTHGWASRFDVHKNEHSNWFMQHERVRFQRAHARVDETPNRLEA